MVVQFIFYHNTFSCNSCDAILILNSQLTVIIFLCHNLLYSQERQCLFVMATSWFCLILKWFFIIFVDFDIQQTHAFFEVCQQNVLACLCTIMLTYVSTCTCTYSTSVGRPVNQDIYMHNSIFSLYCIKKCPKSSEGC